MLAKIKDLMAKQPVIDRLLSLSLKNKVQKRGRQAKLVGFSVRGLFRLSISLRKFRTNKEKRSRSEKQLVIKIIILPYKEIAIKFKIYKRRRDLRYYANQFSTSRTAMASTIALGIIGISFFSLTISSSKQLQPKVNNFITPVAQAAPAPQYLMRSEPTAIRIPKIEINSAVTTVGLKGDGSLDVPASADLVGWYNGSPTPGEKGPSILDGHVDFIDGTAIFWRLGELQPGDIIEIDRTDSTTMKFKVDRVAQYPQDSFPANEVYGNIDYAGIRLITCSGVFDSQTQHYSHNTVVFGSLIN